MTPYAFRTPYPVVLPRGRAYVTSLEAYYEGALVAPSSGTYTLVDRYGTVVIGPSAVVVVDGVATLNLSAGATEDLELGEGYQERWALAMPDGTTRVVRREAGIALFVLHPPASDVDVTEGEYGDLLAEFAGHRQSLQGFFDEAWRQILERLFARAKWPALLVSTSALREPFRQLAMYLAFKELYRSNPGNRWKDLLDIHKAAHDQAWAAMTARWDHDHDGVADGDREALVGVVHNHIGPRAALRHRRDPRW